MLDVGLLKTAIEAGDVTEIKKLMAEYNLKIVDGQITADKDTCKKYYDYWDMRQGIKKRLLNSLYGGTANEGSRWSDTRIAQSTTLSGRSIAKHMQSKCNEVITGSYNHLGESIIYGDSVTGDTVIRTDSGDITIAELFKASQEFYTIGEKAYGEQNTHKVLGMSLNNQSINWGNIHYVMRHKTAKTIYKIYLANGKSVKVTQDHSVMVLRDNKIMESKPTELFDTDLAISLDLLGNTAHIKIVRIEELGEIDDYVYDISIADSDPVFFANDILVHNTDSGFFSAYNVLKDNPDFSDYEWTKENVVQLYNDITEVVNSSFSEFMQQAFHTTPERGSFIKASRETCSTKGMFMTKKRYAVLMYDKDNVRKDVNDKPGEVKAMGLDLKRSDTPETVQHFLSNLLLMALTETDQSKILAAIADFRREFRNWPGWEQGSPKRVNNMTMYGEIYRAKQIVDWEKEVKKTTVKQSDNRKKGKNTDPLKKTIPGHVLASLNWNKLRKIYDDQYSLEIQDGFKVVVCKLRPNPSGMTSVAYPVDQLQLPDWFKSLPFDNDAMEIALIDKKISNLLSVLGWDLTDRKDSTFDDLFSF